jgi:crotonobetainyl-CoA:carnitine CoA-transferase CaiB-like acyl-CoA transferase
MSQMFEVMASISPERTTDEWLALMKQAQVPAMRVNRIDELLDDPQLKASGLIREREHPTEGPYVEVGMPVKFSASQPRALRHPANLGEHSQEVARELGVELAARPRPSA